MTAYKRVRKAAGFQRRCRFVFKLLFSDDIFPFVMVTTGNIAKGVISYAFCIGYLELYS